MTSISSNHYLKLYTALLVLYPKTFRTEYGSLLVDYIEGELAAAETSKNQMQVFRDQCTDLIRSSWLERYRTVQAQYKKIWSLHGINVTTVLVISLPVMFNQFVQSRLYNGNNSAVYQALSWSSAVVAALLLGTILLRHYYAKIAYSASAVAIYVAMLEGYKLASLLQTVLDWMVQSWPGLYGNHFELASLTTFLLAAIISFVTLAYIVLLITKSISVYLHKYNRRNTA